MSLYTSEAVSTAIRHIGIGVYSSGKIYAYLLQKGFSPSVCKEAVDELIDRAYINDFKAGSKILNSRKGKKQESKRMLSDRLKQGGISRDVISELLDELPSDSELCLELYNSVMPNFPDDDYRIIQNELLTTAARRGFSQEIAVSTVNKWLKQF